MLQLTKAVSEREAREQLLDDMDLERERGITIKASAVTVRHVNVGDEHQLNFIDMPGHVDFSCEVSRARGPRSRTKARLFLQGLRPPRAPPPDDGATPRELDSRQLRYVTDLQCVDEPAPNEPVWSAN